MNDFWEGLGDARGFVVGAAVTFLGVLINVIALWGLEAYRARKLKEQADAAWGRQREQEQAAWDRERAARLEELRRDTYLGVLEACEARAFLDETPEANDALVFTRWRASAGTVRFVTDDRVLIDAADNLVYSAGHQSEDAEKATAFRKARTRFVILSRAELGRLALDIRTDRAGRGGDSISDAHGSTQRGSE